MNLYEIILLGVALSMDACAITIANCTAYKSCLSAKKEWAMPILFALFQGVMPLIGYLIGMLFSSVIGPTTKFISAGIFFLLAGKIVYDIIKEARKEVVLDTEKAKTCPIKFTFLMLVIQALATSIDALAVGVTLINLTFSVFIAVSIIASVTFLLVSISLIFGKYLGKIFGKYAEWVGALILIALAVKSLVEALIN